MLPGYQVITQGRRLLGVVSEHQIGTVDQTVDLGDQYLLPMPVNAHCHLDLSSFELPIPAGGHFTDWLSRVVMHRRAKGVEPLSAFKRGAAQLRQAGTRLLGDILASPLVVPASFAEEMAGVIYREVVGLKPARYEELWAWADAEAGSGREVDGGISPHAPYSTNLEVYRRCWPRRPMATHWLESEDERAFLKSGKGPFRDFLERIGAWPDDWQPSDDPWRDYLGTGRWTLVHANYLSSDDEEFLGSPAGRERVEAIVYCPRTHAHFGHPPHPAPRLMARGIPVALGTDSLASNPDLDVWNEAIWLAHHCSSLSPREIFTMATLHGGAALGRPDLGSWAIGRDANLWGIEPSGAEGVDEWERVFGLSAKRGVVVFRGEMVSGSVDSDRA